jgi:PKD repeat protein
VWVYDAVLQQWFQMNPTVSLRYGAEADGDGHTVYLVAGREYTGTFFMSTRNEHLVTCPTCTPPSNAGFTTNPITPQANEPITFTGVATGSGPLTYDWNFGDGATGSGNPIVHTYSTAGAYTVSMTVTGPCGSPVVYTGAVQLGQQAITFVYHDLEDVVQPGENVALAGSFNGWNSNANLMTPDAGYTTFTATLGLFPGTYDYKYIVKSGGDQWDWLNTDNRVITVTTSATVNDYRNVKVGYAVLVGPASTTIELGTSTGPITGELYINNVTNPAGRGRGVAAQVGYGTSSDPSVWAWADSAYVTNNGNNDVFAGALTPTAAGVYSYAVRYDGNWGIGNPNAAWTYGDLDGVYPGNGFNINNVGVLNVTCTPPGNPAFDYTPAAPLVNQTITFTGTASGTGPLTYQWDFGDGATASNNPAAHAYALGNIQTVTMTVAGQCGSPVSHTRNVTVTGTPDIGVGPTTFNVTLSQGQSATRTLTITNSGNGLLTYSFTTTTAAPWLVLPASGTVPAGSAPASLTLTFDTTGLTPNTYFTTLQVQSNDSDQPTVNVSVILNVICDPVTGPDFTFTPANPGLGSVVTFSATVASGSSPITYGWNFDDGSSAGSGQIITHTFPITPLLRTYNVVLTASNACSSNVQASKPVTVWPRMLYLPLIRKN